MIIAHDNEVRLCSEPLDEIWWQGEQWAVTSYGLEARDGTYAIEAERLWERDDNWPVHMAGKNWINIHDFCTAFAVALAMHSKPSEVRPFGRGEVKQACDRAIKTARRYRTQDPPPPPPGSRAHARSPARRL